MYLSSILPKPSGAFLVAWICSAFGCAVGGCAGEAPEDDARSIRTTSEQLNVAVDFELPLGASFKNTAIASVAGNLKINDRAAIQHDRTPPPGIAIYPVAASMGESEIGADAKIGTLVSAGNATVRSRGRVQILETGGQLVRQSGAVVSELTEAAPVAPATRVSIDLDVPDGPGGDIHLEPGSPTRRLAPGEYGEVTVNRAASLQLASGTYSFERLRLESGASLDLINEFGNVNIHVRSGLVHRGSISLTNPDSATVLFVYEGGAPVFIEAPFRGVLVAPRAQVMISGPPMTHVGAFFGSSVELHQGHVVIHRPLAEVRTFGCDVANFTELQDHPFARSREVDNDVQGVTHSSDRWFFTNAKRDFCGLTDMCDFSHIWSFPVGADINDEPATVHDNPWQSTYRHFGDITYAARDGQPGLIYVALEHGLGASSRRGAIGVFEATSLQPVGWSELPRPARQVADQGGSVPWVTYDGEELTYSAAFSSGWLNSYRVNATASSVEIQAGPSRRFRDCGTDAPAFVQRKQGGGMSPTGKLYISVDVQNGGIIVVDPQTGRILDFSAVTFDPGGENEELEGVTIWNLDDGSSPGVRGHVHVQMVQNEIHSDDDFYFKHLQADDFGSL